MSEMIMDMNYLELQTQSSINTIEKRKLNIHDARIKYRTRVNLVQGLKYHYKNGWADGCPVRKLGEYRDVIMAVSRLSSGQFFVDSPDSDRIAVPSLWSVSRSSASSMPSKRSSNALISPNSGVRCGRGFA